MIAVVRACTEIFYEKITRGYKIVDIRRDVFNLLKLLRDKIFHIIKTCALTFHKAGGAHGTGREDLL